MDNTTGMALGFVCKACRCRSGNPSQGSRDVLSIGGRPGDVSTGQCFETSLLAVAKVRHGNTEHTTQTGGRSLSEIIKQAKRLVGIARAPLLKCAWDMKTCAYHSK